MVMSKAKPSLSGYGGPQQARVAAALQHGLQVRAKIGVFRAEVDDALRRADDPRADRHAFEHQVGELGQDHAVFERARLAFVGIADHVLLLARGDLAANSHFRLVGKPAPPRPRSPEDSTLRKASAEGRASAARSPLPGSMVLKVS